MAGPPGLSCRLMVGICGVAFVLFTLPALPLILPVPPKVEQSNDRSAVQTIHPADTFQKLPGAPRQIKE